MDEQVVSEWEQLLYPIAQRVNPAHEAMFQDFNTSYYWSIQQSEWATDLLFKNSDALERLYPHLIHHGLISFASPDVMRFFGKKVPLHGKVHRKFQGEIVSDVKDRTEGIRVKHRLGKNSLKMYDKHGIILRIETTLNNTAPFLVYRTTERDKDAKPKWLPLRKGIADLQRRTQLSQRSNERYLEALAQVECNKPLEKLCAPICTPTYSKGKRFRALNPFEGNDNATLKALGSGEFCIHGFRNKDLRKYLFGISKNKALDKKHSAKVTRQIRLLRAHGLIKKVPRAHRYNVTDKGQQAIMTILAAGAVGCKKLTELAA